MLSKKSARDGIALVFVISLIVVFFLFATTLVVMSSSYMRSTDRAVRVERTKQYRFHNVADDAMMLLLRSSAGNSPAYQHSLLADQYGTETIGQTLAAEGSSAGYFVAVTAVSPAVLPDVSNPNFIDIAFDPNSPSFPAALSGYFVDSTLNDFLSKEDFLGRWLTFIDGPMNKSTLPILDYVDSLSSADGLAHFYVLPLVKAESHKSIANLVAATNANSRFVVNGRPFNGGRSSRVANEPYDAVTNVYDEEPVDNPNYFLANNDRVINPTSNRIGLLNEDLGAKIESQASFHRSGYFRESGSTPNNIEITPGITTYRELMDVVAGVNAKSGRPNPILNPNFTGSNPNYTFFGMGAPYQSGVPNFTFEVPGFYRENGFNALSTEHWTHLIRGLYGNDQTVLDSIGLPAYAGMDVDNDGDGQPDSIWLDLGLSEIQLENGTRVKPLVAVLIEDLDGRLNLNAHGSLADWSRLYNSQTAFGPHNIPFGQGYGPADIPLSTLVDGDEGRLRQLLRLRYGADQTTATPLQPDMSGSMIAALMNPLQKLRWFGRGDGTIDTPARPIPPNLQALYVDGSASDHQAQFFVGHPSLGTTDSFFDTTTTLQLPFFQRDLSAPILPGVPSPVFSQTYDSPYEFNVFEPTSPSTYWDYAQNPPVQVAIPSYDRDKKFSPADLYAVFSGGRSEFVAETKSASSNRAYDAGIADFLTYLASDSELSRQVTTESYEVPALPRGVAEGIRLSLKRDSGFTNAEADNHTALMFGYDIVSGLPLNLNLPFGDGLDNDGDGIIDEYGHPGNGGNIELNNGFDINRNGSSTNDDAYYARIGLARQIYCLAYFLCRPTTEEQQVTLAQWAINVVDFQDTDSISTPFEFDLNPLNGWGDADDPLDGELDSDDDGHSERRVVWGLERPDLLLAEAVAFHEHRSYQVGASSQQTHVPTGSAFIEIYNPNFQPSVDIRKMTDTHLTLLTGQKGVNLKKVTADDEPIYRILIVESESRGANPDRTISDFDRLFDDHLDDSSAQNVFDPNDVERTLYFVDPTPLLNNMATIAGQTKLDGSGGTYGADVNLAGQFATGDIQHFPHTDLGINYVLQPGHTALVGSAGHDQTFTESTFTTIFGRVTGAPADSSYDADTHSVGQFAIRVNDGAEVEVGPYDFSAASQGLTTVPRTIGVPVDMALDPTAGSPTVIDRNFSITEPITNYYPMTDSAGNPVEAEVDGLRYDTPYNSGFYENSGYCALEVDTYGQVRDPNDADNANNPTYRHLVLQRLANPEQPFHPVRNPFLTVDDIGINVNAFGGLGNDQRVGDPTARPGAQRMPLDLVSSMQRGLVDSNSEFAFSDTAAVVSNFSDNNVWLRTADGLWQSNPAGQVDAEGALPSNFFTDNTSLAESISNPTNGLDNPHYFGGNVPWFRFANRPLISQFELASVPVQSSGLLLEHIVWPDLADDSSSRDVINSTLRHTDVNRVPTYLYNFQSSAAETDKLWQIFDYTTVPSPFVGAETYLDEVSYAGSFFGKPYNYVSKRRNPGKVNLNTITGKRVWDSLQGGENSAYADQNTGLSFVRYLDAFRRPPTDGNEPDPNIQSSADLNEPRIYASDSNPFGVSRSKEFSLWRSTDGSNPYPLFDPQPALSAADYELERNEYFQYQMRQRLGNMTTQRSSVFSMYVTIGYFEVEEVKVPVPVNENVPYNTAVYNVNNYVQRTAIGREYGSINGKTKRDRAFYLIDRSIPVGFVPGENLNVEKTILLKRYIE